MQLEIYFNHQCAWDILSPPILIGLRDMIKNLDFTIERGSGPLLREQIMPMLHVSGWSGEFLFHPESKSSITALRESCGMCMQTGNMSRFYADLIKLEYLYINEVIDGGIYIVPTKKAAKIMGSNIANFERLTQELSLFKQVISIPLVVFGIE